MSNQAPVSDDDEVVAEARVEPFESVNDGKQREFPCKACGAYLEWSPGTTSLECPYCGSREELPTDERTIQESSLQDYISTKGKHTGLGIESREIKCGACGAQVELAGDVSMQECPFCGSAVQDEVAHDDRIRPEAIVPFALTQREARERFKAWLTTLWFAPNDLAEMVQPERLRGIYRPWWTFDAQTVSHWSGQAGEYYYETQYYTDKDGNRQSRRVRKTRWYPRSGVYHAFFDDELVKAYRSTDMDAHGYDLTKAIPYTPDVVAGFICERYTDDPEASWPRARSLIDVKIRSACQQRLEDGYDTSRHLSVTSAYNGITFKSMVLPAWHGTYRYYDKVFRVTVNGQSGAVSAERPYSTWKIALAILVGLLVLAGLITVAVLVLSA